MKQLLICVFMFLAYCCHAQNVNDPKLSIQINCQYNKHLGGFYCGEANNFFTGQSNNSWGGTISVLKLIKNGFGVGISVANNFCKVNKDDVRSKLLAMYGSQEYFTTTSFSTGFQLSQFSLVGFKKFHLSAVSVAPFLRLGFGLCNPDQEITVYLKKRNDNYFESNKIVFDDSENESTLFFYPSAGLDVSFPINRFMELNTGILYSIGRKKMSYSVASDNLFSEKHIENHSYTQVFSSLQFFLGLQFNFMKTD